MIVVAVSECVLIAFMASKTSEVSFAIRFKPSSFGDDDDDDDDDIDPGNHPLACKPKKETVLFERQSVTTSSHGTQCDSDVEQTQQGSQIHPDTSCNSQTDVSKSVASEAGSPQTTQDVASNVNDKTLPIKTSGSKDNVKDPAATPTVEKSLFSGLKERLDRLSAESKEIFDRKMRRSGSADAAKITAMLNSGDSDKISDESSKAAESRHTRSPSDGTSICSEHSQGSITPVDHHSHDISSAVSSGPSHMHKSASVGATLLTKHEETHAMDSLAWSKSSTAAADYELATFKSSDKMSLSDLLTTCNDEDLDGLETKMTKDVSSEGILGSEESECSGKPCKSPPVKHQKVSSFVSAIRKWRDKISVFIGLLAYILIPLPTYLSGFVTGSLCTVIIIAAYLYLIKLKKPTDVPLKPTLTPATVVSAEIKETVKEASKSKPVEAKFKVCPANLQQFLTFSNCIIFCLYEIKSNSCIIFCLAGYMPVHCTIIATILKC